MNKVEDLPELTEAAGMWFKQLPIIDMAIPNQDFENDWAVEGERIRHALRIGERVAIHCYAGLGRTGMIAARILVELGVDPERAIRQVRRDNRRRIQTKSQANFVRSCYSLVDIV
jgi:protein-tyrosine phosphatase